LEEDVAPRDRAAHAAGRLLLQLPGLSLSSRPGASLEGTLLHLGALLLRQAEFARAPQALQAVHLPLLLLGEGEVARPRGADAADDAAEGIGTGRRDEGSGDRVDGHEDSYR